MRSDSIWNHLMSTQNIDLTDKVAVVSGASRGVGQRIAFRLAEHGAAVALVARATPALQDTARIIRERGGTAVVISADLRQMKAAQAVKAQMLQELGKPAILVHAAGIFGPISLIRDAPLQDWLDTIQVNTLAAFALCQEFVGGMIDHGWGRIVNVSSAASLHPPGRLNSAYVTSKVALNQLTRHLAAELEGTGVTANVIHPGDVKTEMWAYIRDTAGQLGAEAVGYSSWARWVDETGGDDPEKAADLVVTLMSDSASTINGQFLWIRDGLQPPRPSWGDADAGLPWSQ